MNNGRQLSPPPLTPIFERVINKNGRLHMTNDVGCPKCRSPTVRVSNATQPRAYECMDCGHEFVRGKSMLTDE